MSINMPLALMFLTLVLQLNLAQAPAGQPSPAPPKPSPMEQNWLDLQNGEFEAARALFRMSTTPKESVAFLKVNLKPLKLEAEELTKALTRLDSDDEMVWKAAYEELEYFDPRLAVDLETLMENVTTKPLRQRLFAVLVGGDADRVTDSDVLLKKMGGDDSFRFVIPGGASRWAEARVSRLGPEPLGEPKRKWSRAARAIVLLEHIKSPEAIALLKDMAAGHPDAAPTKYAAEALQRIEGKEPKAKVNESAKP